MANSRVSHRLDRFSQVIMLAAFAALTLNGCGKKFEPELKGWRATTRPGQPRLDLNMDGREKEIELPGGSNVWYRFVQWTKQEDLILLAQVMKRGSCDDYQIVSVDTTGMVVDTIYTAPPRTPVNFKLAPNDSLLLLKTYRDNCVDESSNSMYTFYNRFSRKALPDTIRVGDARGLLLQETVWSPDSRKVIIAEWYGRQAAAFTYDLATKDTINIDNGTNFIWSPADNDLVGYIKDYSIYTMNIVTGKKEVIFEGKKKRSATDFRWSPRGDYLMINLQRYLLNVGAGPFQQHLVLYVSMKDKSESRIYYDEYRMHTWKDPDLIQKK